MRQLGTVTGKKLIAVSWWTFAYVIVAGALLAFSAAGDCSEGSEGAACRAQSSSFTTALLVAELVTYLGLTWLFFFRRR